MPIGKVVPVPLADFFNFCLSRTDALLRHASYISDASFDGAVIVFNTKTLVYAKTPVLLTHDNNLCVTGYCYLDNKFFVLRNMLSLSSGISSNGPIRPGTPREINTLLERLIEEEDFNFILS